MSIATEPPTRPPIPPSGVPEMIDGVPVEIVEPAYEPYTRAAGDKLRVGLALIVFLASILVAAIFQKLIGGAETEVKEIASRVPTGLSQFLVGLDGTIVALSVLGLVSTLVYLRRLRVTGMVVLAVGASYVLMDLLSAVLSNPVLLPADLGQVRFIAAGGPHFLAMGAAVVTVLGAWFPRWVRRAGIATVAFVGFTRIANLNTPYDVAMSVVLGWLVGALIVMVFGSPNRHPVGRSVAEALDRAGIAVRRLEWLGVGTRGSTVYVADVADGSQQFVKVFNDDQRDADLILQAIRWVRLREANDERAFSSLRRQVEHEALLSLKAADDGIPTARMHAVAEVDPDGFLLAFDYIEGDPLAGRGDAISDDLLHQVWSLAESLQTRHIAHRDLNLAHLLERPGGGIAVVDFGFGELAARPAELRSDLAELLCSVAIEVGPERAVASALATIGPDRLADMVSRLQPLALTSVTRAAVKEHDGLLDDLRTRVQEAAGLDEVRLEELARVRPRTIGIIVVFTVALYALLPQLPAVQDLPNQLGSANWWWAPPILVCMCVTWLGATFSVTGAVPDRLPFWPMFRAQMAASFLDTLAPAGLGGLALNTRTMQKRGVDPAVAVAGMGLNGVAGFVMHLVLLGVFLLWTSATGGATGDQNAKFTPPDGKTILIGVGVVSALVVLAFILPITRNYVRDKGLPMVRQAGRGLAELARKPRKLLSLFGGSTLVTLGFYGALLCAVEAFGGGLTPAQTGAAYMIAFSVAIFAPTPGSLGALEFSLITAFQGLGMNADSALASVSLFRFGTFFLPILPGWIVFTYMQRRGDV